MHRLVLIPLVLAGCSATNSSSIDSSSGGTATSGTGGSGTLNLDGGVLCYGGYGTIVCPAGWQCDATSPICNPPTSGGSGGSTHRSTSQGTSTGGSTGSIGPDAGPPYAQGWPKWHCDNADQGLSPADTSANQGTLLWKFSVGVPMQSTSITGLANPNPSYLNSPVVDGTGVVYELGMSGSFYAVGDGGAQLWTTTLLPPNPDTHPGTPIIAADGTIYVETGADGASTTSAAQLYHLDSTTGRILFQSGPPPGQADGFDVCPSIGGDGLLFDDDDFFTYVTYSLQPNASFTVSHQTSLLLVGERVALALDSSDNSYWCASNLCLAVTPPEQGFSVNPNWNPSGQQIGDVPGNGATWTNSDLAFDERHTGWLMVEAGVQDGGSGSTEVAAMDPSNGLAHWATKLPSGPTPGSYNSMSNVGIFSADVGNSAPAIGPDGAVYVGNVDGLYSLDGGTGAIGWSYMPSQDTGANADVDTAPAIGSDGTIFFGTAGGTLYAVKPDGTERFHYTTGGRISCSPAIGPDGTVFFVSDDGYLYAIR